MVWSRQQYEDRMRDHLGDLGIIQHIPETSIPLALERALATFTKDRPRTAAHLLSGDGSTQSFNLLTGPTAAPDWQDGWSRIQTIEHPTGDIPKTYLDRGHDWNLEDGVLEFTDAPATGTNNIKIRHTALWDFPDDDPSDDVNPIPEIYAHAIAALAASNLIRGKAVEFARQASTSVAGDLFQRDPEPLFTAAKELKSEYEDTVLGRSGDETTPSQLGYAVADVDVFPAALLHTRAEIIAEETLGG